MEKVEPERVAPERVEPERELVRRALPMAAAALAIASSIGAATGGWNAALSAAIGVLVVAVNLVASGLSMAWAAGVSPVALYVVGLGGFVVRLVIVFGALFGLQTLEWFSPVAFVVAVVPTSAVVLAMELRVLAGRRLQSELWYFREQVR